MPTLYVTDGDPDTIVTGVGLTVLDYTAPDGDYSVFGDISEGYLRKMDVDLAALDGLLSGAGIIGYFTEAALAKPRPGADVPLLVEMIAARPHHDGIVLPLFRNSPDSIAGRAPPQPLSAGEQQALFVRVLGKEWPGRVERLLKVRAAAAAQPEAGDGGRGTGDISRSPRSPAPSAARDGSSSPRAARADAPPTPRPRQRPGAARGSGRTKSDFPGISCR